MSVESQQLQKSKLIGQAQAILSRGLKPNEKAEYANLVEEIDSIQRNLDTLATLQAKMDKLGITPKAEPAPEVRASRSSAEGSENRARISAAYRHFLVNGYKPGAPEQRDLTTASDVDGDAVVPTTFAKNEIAQAIKFVGPIAGLVSVSYQETGAGQKVPVSDDTASVMTLLAESGATSSLEHDPTLFSTLHPGSDTLVSTVLYSKQEAEDVEDTGSYLAALAGVRIARGLETAITLGTDNSTSKNVLPNSPTGGLIGTLSAGVTGVAISGPTYANLTALKASVDNAYRIGPNHGFLVNQATHDYLVAQVDSTGRPLYKHNPNTGLLMVAGSPVYINSAMQSFTQHSAPVAMYGDYSKAYKIVLAGSLVRIRILTERFADEMLNAAIFYTRLQGIPLITAAVKTMTTVS
ncbi:MAG TPA: phage major capsid protein [Acidobacteriaceae bacterium]|jgi:HK97 family phage major capsid protein|nr:phage major capsid protein [Acidobacteriaceae bacterium]